ncbi:unnamed protein product, partial [Bubo scandiacus]
LSCPLQQNTLGSHCRVLTAAFKKIFTALCASIVLWGSLKSPVFATLIVQGNQQQIAINPMRLRARNS